MKRGRSKAKGGAFERLVAKSISLWWSNGNREDIFFRTASSGGRATQRGKQGKSTFGQYGDLQAVDSIGKPLMDLVTVECKDGYPGVSPLDLIDRTKLGKQTYGEFFAQAIEESKAAMRPYWLLIARRKGHAIMVYMPMGLYNELSEITTCSIQTCAPHVKLRCTIGNELTRIYGTPLDRFLKSVSPEDIKAIS